jgi:hypothetical protein
MISLHGLLACMACLPVAVHAEPPLPIRSGQYAFQMKDAEYHGADFATVNVKVTISGRHIVIVSDDSSSTLYPKGALIHEGMLMWHAASRQWIVGNAEPDRHAREVGDCSDGPEVIDLRKRVYWTC